MHATARTRTEPPPCEAFDKMRVSYTPTFAFRRAQNDSDAREMNRSPNFLQSVPSVMNLSECSRAVALSPETNLPALSSCSPHRRCIT